LYPEDAGAGSFSTWKTQIMMNQTVSRWGSKFTSLALVVFAGIFASKADGTRWRDSSFQEKIWNERGCKVDQRGKWFRDAKFGAFIHFGPYSQLGGYWKGKGPFRPAEQIIGLGERKAVISPDEYRTEVAGRFNPTNFNARAWVSAIKSAGQKYVIVTTKHHDGFCMFNTSTTSNNIVDATSFARDVIKELADECRAQGIEFCPYYSIGDWCAAEVQNPRFKNYPDYMFSQLEELLTRYGDIKLLWFDNYWYVDNQWTNDEAHAKELYAFVRSLSPNTLVNDRCGAGVNSTDGDYATPENQLKGSRQSRYFEVVMTDTEDDNWGWVKGATNYRDPASLIRNLIDCTSKGGNFVLNTGITATGEIPPEHLAILAKIGPWMATNGEAIYGTEPASECVPQLTSGFEYHATKSGTNIYLLVIRWPESSVPASVTIKRTGFKGAELLDRSLSALDVSATEDDGAVTLSISKPDRIDPYATVIKLNFESEGSDLKRHADAGKNNESP
jgi:alpha-L-fucosidase